MSILKSSIRWSGCPERAESRKHGNPATLFRMTPEMMEHGRIGVELMTAKAGGDDSAGFLNERLQALIQEHMEDGKQGRTGLLAACVGLSNVASVLMFMLAEQTGQTEQAILQDVARYFHAQD